MKIRYECFGGIVFTERPAFTVFVDKNYMKQLGCAGSPLWSGNNSHHLSAPLNVHFDLTKKCTKQCHYCYAESTNDQVEEISTPDVKDIIDQLSEMKVFSISFGGGEPLLRDDIFEIAKYTRDKNITPTITTNGLCIDQDNAQECTVFDHIHVSVNLAEESTPVPDRQWHRALLLLKDAGVNVGINYVVDKNGFDHLTNICSLGNTYNIRDIMFLRFKPFGRAKTVYTKNKLSAAENIRFFTLIKKLSKKYQIRPMVDCSFLPMICWHKPKMALLEFYGAQGCQGGNYIVEIDSRGHVRCCSFCKDYAGEAANIRFLWNNSSSFGLFRDWINNAPAPCSSCNYLRVCRGGCHCIAQALTGDMFAPDPECPFVKTRTV